MWEIEATDRFARRRKKYERGNSAEIAAMLDNLDTYLSSLNQGGRPMQMFRHRFVHNERRGVHAIDPSPLKRGYLALRLYVFPDERDSTLHLITLGDKQSQARDVQECVEYVEELLASRGAVPPDEDEAADDDRPPS